MIINTLLPAPPLLRGPSVPASLFATRRQAYLNAHADRRDS